MILSRIKESVHGRWVPLLMIALGALILILLLSWLAHPVPVTAAGDDLTRFITRYTSADGTKLDACALCHTSNPPALNPYGAAYSSNGRSTGALATIEPLDSDGDSWTNLQEIQAFTFPGNATDRPATVPTATSTTAPTVGATGTVVPTPTVTTTPVPIGTIPRIFLPLVSTP